MAPIEELNQKFDDLDLEDLSEEQIAMVQNFRDLDDQYLASKKEFEAKVLALENEYRKGWKTLVDKRSEMLKKGDGIESFWVRVFSNCEALEDYIEECDIPVLEYLQDVTTERVDENAPEKGFKIIFEFRENPYFENTKIVKTYISDRIGKFSDAEEIEKIECDEIKWKAGKNITVKTVQKKKKSGRKGNQQKTVTEQQSVRCLFRQFFRSIDPEDELSDVDSEEEEEELDEDEIAQKTDMIMNDDWETGMMLRDCVIPHAVRWFTGEAVSDMEDDEDDEDDEDSDDFDSDEDSDDDSPVRPKKGAAKGGEQKEECKQQ